MPSRHVPIRSCAACRTARPKAELIRVVRTPEGMIEVDPSGRAAGRGAYVCRRPECAQAAVRKDAMRRALGRPLPPGAAELLLAAAKAGPAATAPPAAMRRRP